MNKVFLLGRNVKEPTMRKANDKDIALFCIAVRRNEKESDFINCVAFGKSAEIASKLVKGQQACVTGRLQVRKYEDTDGKTCYATEVICDMLELIYTKDKQSDFTPVTESDVF